MRNVLQTSEGNTYMDNDNDINVMQQTIISLNDTTELNIQTGNLYI